MILGNPTQGARVKRTGHLPSQDPAPRSAGEDAVAAPASAPPWAMQQQEELGNAAVQGLMGQEPAPDPLSALRRADPATLAAQVAALGSAERGRLRADRTLLAELAGQAAPEERAGLLRAVGVALPQQVLLGALGGWLDAAAAQALLLPASAEEQERLARHGAAALLLMAMGSPLTLLPALCAAPQRAARTYAESFFFGVWVHTDLEAWSTWVEAGELEPWAQALAARGAWAMALELVGRSPDPARWAHALAAVGALERARAQAPAGATQAQGAARLGAAA